LGFILIICFWLGVLFLNVVIFVTLIIIEVFVRGLLISIRVWLVLVVLGEGGIVSIWF